MTTANRDDMTCRELVELVTDYFENRLSPADRLRFEKHVVWCPACGVYLRQMRTTIELSGKLAESDVPEAAKSALLSAFRNWKKDER